MTLHFDSTRVGPLEIGTNDAAEIDVWVTLRAAGELADFSRNLRAPIVVRNGRGHQVIKRGAGRPRPRPAVPGLRDRSAA